MLQRLRHSRRAVVMITLVIATITLPMIATQTPAVAAVCKNSKFTQIGKDPVFVNKTAWSMTAGVTWCYSTGTNPHLISVKWSRSAKALCCGWDFEGWAGNNDSGCYGYDTCHWAFRRVTAEFAYAPLVVVVYRIYPYIQFTVRDDGTCSFGSSALGGPYTCPT